MTAPRLFVCRLWWIVKVGLFPHLERRQIPRVRNRRDADDALVAAMTDLERAISNEDNCRARKL